jgi:hypothetical protein
MPLNGLPAVNSLFFSSNQLAVRYNADSATNILIANFCQLMLDGAKIKWAV